MDFPIDHRKIYCYIICVIYSKYIKINIIVCKPSDFILVKPLQNNVSNTEIAMEYPLLTFPLCYMFPECIFELCIL